MSETFLFLSKVLPLVVMPLGFAISLALLAMIAAAFRRRKLAWTGGGVALLILWIAATPGFANFAYSILEDQFPPTPVEACPKVDVAIVLGGALGLTAFPTQVKLADASDRMLYAVRLYRAGKVSRILVSGGMVPWATSVPEAELMRQLLIEWQVPADAIIMESKSRNTFENAVETKRIHDQDPFGPALLITSAAHMPRAVAAFRHSGLSVIPFSVDVRGKMPGVDPVVDWLPDARSLSRSTDALREGLGVVMYRLRGWL